MIHERGNSFIGMPDNGFGSKSNSIDFVLGFYRVDVMWARAGAPVPGPINVRQFTPLSDPQDWLKNGSGVDLSIIADSSIYPGTLDPVDQRIRAGRLLTGYDFDVESMASDGTGGYWIGEEFGPFLLHVNGRGELIGEPVEHPYLRSPSHPDVLVGLEQATTAGSRGFEGLAFGTDDQFLYVIAEAAPTVLALRAAAEDERLIRILEFDQHAATYTGRDYVYKKDGESTQNAVVIGDMIHIAERTFALIERDSASGADAEIKRIYLFDLGAADRNGLLCKRLVVDLLHIANPATEGRLEPFSLPFDSVESLSLIDARTLVVGVDTNYPTQATRTAGVADGTEVISVRFPVPLAALAPTKSATGACAA